MATRVTKELEQAPLPDLVKNLALAIGHAQQELDHNTVKQIQQLAGQTIELPGLGSPSLLQLGLMPTFYHFTETTIEARVTFTTMESREFGVTAEVGGNFKVFTASLNAHYTSKYSFEATGSSVISTKLVSVPPPEALAQLVNQFVVKKDQAEGK